MNEPRNKMTRTATVLACLLAAATQVQAQNGPWMVLISPDNSFNFDVYKDGQPVAALNAYGWGPNWGWRGFGAKTRATGDELNVSAPFEADKAAGQIINVTLNAKKSAPQAVSFRYTLSADKTVSLTSFVFGVATKPGFQDGQVLLNQAGGGQTTWPLSLSGIRAAPPTSKIAFQPKNAGELSLNIEPPTPPRPRAAQIRGA